MANGRSKRTILVITACMTPQGLPDFALSTVEVTPDEFDNGAHYALAELLLGARGYEEPYVHFEQQEAPPFLVPAVQAYLECKTGGLVAATQR
jgi:hypothetical protein